MLRRLFVHRAHWRSDVKTRRLCPVIPLSTDVRFQMGTMGQGAGSGQGVYRYYPHPCDFR